MTDWIMSDHLLNDVIPPSATQTQGGDQELAPIVTARFIGSLRKIYGALKAIQIDGKSEMVVLCDPKGLKFTVDHAQTVQARAFLQAGLFCEYECVEEDVEPFCIDSSTFLACMNIFQSGTSNGDVVTTVSMSYCGEGTPLVVMVEESGVIAECNINTMEPQESMDFNTFSSDEVEVKIIFDSEALKEAFSEIDKSSRIIEFEVAKATRTFSVSTHGNCGAFTVAYTHEDKAAGKEGSSVFSFFESKHDNVLNRYLLPMLRPCERGLGLANKTSLKMNDRGFLKMQNMIYIELPGQSQPEITYIEYTCAPVEDDAE